eukprot:1150870-Pelagomonas_calceolata.AAC.2
MGDLHNCWVGLDLKGSRSGVPAPNPPALGPRFAPVLSWLGSSGCGPTHQGRAAPLVSPAGAFERDTACMLIVEPSAMITALPEAREECQHGAWKCFCCPSLPSKQASQGSLPPLHLYMFTGLNEPVNTWFWGLNLLCTSLLHPVHSTPQQKGSDCQRAYT